MPKTKPKKYLTQKGLADRWEVARTTIYRWEKDKRPMPPTTGTGPRKRYALADVEAFERKHRRPGRKATPA